MVNTTDSGDEKSGECRVHLNSSLDSSEDTSSGDFNWDTEQQGLVLGAFFYGYIVTQIPGGRLSEVFGSKWIFGGSQFITAVCALLCPLAAYSNFYAFLTIRVIQGLAEGVAFPRYCRRSE